MKKECWHTLFINLDKKNKFLQKLTQGDIFGKKDEQSSKSCFSDFSFA